MPAAQAGRLALRPPPGGGGIPPFQQGWLREGAVEAYLSYASDADPVNWSDELELLHEESTREHFIDVWTRRAILERLGPLPGAAVICDLGCSSGYLLEELQALHPDALLVGVDLVAAGLREAHRNVPAARLVQADVCALPFEDESFDAVVSANLLEHVGDDVGAMRELRRVLRPGARGVLVVPAGPDTYDYYDRFLGHERRYGRGELAAKARGAGLEVDTDMYLASLLYPAFRLVKRRNRRLHGDLRGEALAARVARDIASTRDSRLGHLVAALERTLAAAGLRLPFGIRGLTVVRRPARP